MLQVVESIPLILSNISVLVFNTRTTKFKGTSVQETEELYRQAESGTNKRWNTESESYLTSLWKTL